MTPTVAVVITNHNYARYLVAAVESVLRQSSPPEQVVVVDDGSTDDSREVMATYADRITVIHQENRGQAAAVTTGFGSCTADIVLFLDADDLLEPDAIARVRATFAADRSLVRVHFTMRVVASDGSPTGAVRPPAHLSLPSGDLSASTIWSLGDLPWAAMSANAFTRRVLCELLPAPADTRDGVDWYLVHTSSLYGPVATLPGILGRYRVHDANSYAKAFRGSIPLDHVRETIRLSERTRASVRLHAQRLGVPIPAFEAVGMSEVGNRMIALRLSAREQVRSPDSRRGLLTRGLRACVHRRDVGMGFKVAFGIWLASTACAPRRLAERLAVAFLFPDEGQIVRRVFNRVRAHR